MDDVIDFIDRDMSAFVCGDYGYNIGSGKGVLNSEWNLIVRPKNLATSVLEENPVGYIQVEKVADNMTRFLVPPKVNGREAEEERPSDHEAKLFFSFVCQTINAFQRRGYVRLPGYLPVE